MFQIRQYSVCSCLADSSEHFYFDTSDKAVQDVSRHLTDSQRTCSPHVSFLYWCAPPGWDSSQCLLSRAGGGGGSGFTWRARGEYSWSLQHGLSPCRLLCHVVIEPPQTFLGEEYFSYVAACIVELFVSLCVFFSLNSSSWLLFRLGIV